MPDERSVSFGYTTSNGVTRLTSVTDARGKVWEYTYDAHGLLEKVIDPLDHTVVRNVYDGFGRVTDQYDGLDNHATFSWDGETQTSTFTDGRGKEFEDAYGNNILQSSTDPLDDEFSYTFDADMNVTAITDARGYTTSFSYDDAGNMLTRTAPSPLSYVEEWTYNGFNDPLTYEDGRGNTTSYSYDSAGNLTEISQPGDIDTEYERDAGGSGLLVSLTDPRGKTTEYGYDAGHNLTSVTTPLGFETTLGYDASGRLTWRVDARGNEQGADPDDYKTLFTYDAADNMLSETDPLGNDTAWAYDDAGRLASVTDANDHVTGYTYDAADRLTVVTAPDDSTTEYTYDANGNQLTRSDANEHVTSYSYDDANRLIETESPIGQTWTYAYDAVGNRTSMVDANGNDSQTAGDGTTSYSYDALNRLTAIDYSDSTPDVTYTYDGNGNRSQMSDGGTVSYTYDALNRVTEIARGTDDFDYVYDDAGNVTERSHPDDTEIDYTYDNDGRLATLTHDSRTSTYTYDAAGNPTQLELPAANGYIETREYDEAGRVTLVEHDDGNTLASFAYVYDAAGNPTSMNKLGGVVEKYSYDALDRLTAVCYQSSCPNPSDPKISYLYDPVGNRTVMVDDTGTTEYDYNSADQLTLVTHPDSSTTAYTYDENGNQTQAGSRSYTYDLADRLVSTTQASITTSYSYDGDGVRRTRTHDGSTVSEFWDTNHQLPQLALERGSGGASLRAYLHGLQPIAYITDDDPYYLHTDRLGSVHNITDEAGDTQWTYSYEPYGNPLSETKNDPNAPANRLRYTGQYHDPTTGDYHLRARTYNPTTGRFQILDPVSEHASSPVAAAYLYSSSRPTALSDPAGLFTIRGCLGLQATLFGTRLAAKGCLAVSSESQFGVSGSMEAAKSTNLFSGAIFGEIDASSANYIEDVTGFALTAGAEAGEGVIGRISSSGAVGRGRCGETIYGSSLAAGVGGRVPLPAEIYGGASYTKSYTLFGPSAPACTDLPHSGHGGAAGK